MGFAPVSSSNENWGYIDKEGKYIINPQFKIADNFNNGLAAVQTAGIKYGIIDVNGKYLNNPQFEAIILNHKSTFFNYMQEAYISDFDFAQNRLF